MSETIEGPVHLGMHLPPATDGNIASLEVEKALIDGAVHDFAQRGHEFFNRENGPLDSFIAELQTFVIEGAMIGRKLKAMAKYAKALEAVGLGDQMPDLQERNAELTVLLNDLVDFAIGTAEAIKGAFKTAHSKQDAVKGRAEAYSELLSLRIEQLSSEKPAEEASEVIA